MEVYYAVATREGRWWIVTVPNVGATQASSISQAKVATLNLINSMTNIPTDDIELKIEFNIAANVTAEEIKQARNLTLEVIEAQRRAGQLSRRVVTALRNAGLSTRDVGEILGISAQRVSQLDQKTIS